MKRLEEKMQELEDKLCNDLLNQKRKAEQELEHEMEARRAKRLREVDDEARDKRAEKESLLTSLEQQLQEKMLLVADEQEQLDNLRDRSREMQKALEQARSPPETPNKAVTKDALRLKLAACKQAPTAAAASAAPHQAAQTSPTHGADQPSLSTPCQALVPTCDMRFTSSTHPQAWQFLYRMQKGMDKESSDASKEIYDKWHAGALK